MSDGEGEHLNAEAARGTQEGAAGATGISLREGFLRIAAARGMFGSVPSGGDAADALESAARAMLEQAERHGVSVENIVDRAGEVADLANMTDEEVALQNKLAADQRPGGGQEMLPE
ncbi:hypothetical protein [Streptomyces xiaopingdaonensis]|uniref:hypothetical protein n=1 Tax=Streptomyces xiaopingdaonensis TaxID=1565415 RepID=UPI0002DBEAB9|nr:hypothetical protein [Streptomyces xiaopingdaonensis]